MLTKQQMFLDFIGAPDTRFAIPVYQRVYAWNPRQCDQLWNDALRAGRANATHFIGTVLYAVEPGSIEGEAQFDIIDGQQRMATLSLLLIALRDFLREGNAVLEGIDADGIDRRFLHASGDKTACKLVLSRADKATYGAVVNGSDLPGEDDASANVTANYEHFRHKMDADFTVEDARALWSGLQRLLVIAAAIDGDDRPQIIFESLNSKGMPLTTADLVRNLMLVNVGYDEQTRLYERYWLPIEKLFGGDDGSVRLNAALHGWLAITAPQLHIGSPDEVYGAFKIYLEDMHTGSLEELLIGLKGFCETFAAKSQAAGANHGVDHANWANGKVAGIISEKKLFGD